MRKTITSFAMSLDGYIANEDGSFEWIIGDGNKMLDTPNKWDYAKLLEGIDIVVMGKQCFYQDMHKDFPNQIVYVATSEPFEDYDNIRFTSNIQDIVAKLKKQDGKDIFLFGGSILIDGFIKNNTIDEYIIGIVPTILGKGKPLFLKDNPTILLSLDSYASDDGIVILYYSKRKL